MLALELSRMACFKVRRIQDLATGCRTLFNRWVSVQNQPSISSNVRK